MRIFLAFCFFLFHLASSSQETIKPGRYVSGDYFINIISDTAMEFHMNSGGCLSHNMYGYGSYTFNGKKVKVKTKKHDSQFSPTYQVRNDYGDSSIVQLSIYNSSGELAEYYEVLLMDRKNKPQVVDYARSNELGYAEFEALSGLDIQNLDLVVNCFAYGKFKIPLTKVVGKNISVYLKQCELIENTTVILRVDNKVDSIYVSHPKIRKRQTRCGRKLRNVIYTMFTHWPWKWNFKGSGADKKTKFVLVSSFDAD
jgi:hypothetical protein